MAWYIAWPIDDPQQIRMQIWKGVILYRNIFHVDVWKVYLNEKADLMAFGILEKMGVKVEEVNGCKQDQMLMAFPLGDRKHDSDFYDLLCMEAGLIKKGDGFVKEVKS